MDLKESCTTEERVVAVVGDGSWFYWVDEVAVHPPGDPERIGNGYWQDKPPEYASVHGALQVGLGGVEAVHQGVPCLADFLPHHTSATGHVKHLAKSFFWVVFGKLGHKDGNNHLGANLHIHVKGCKLHLGLGYEYL